MVSAMKLPEILIVSVLAALVVFTCANIPKYAPPEMPKPSECELVIDRITNSLNEARDALKTSIKGKIVHFENRLLSVMCLEKEHVAVHVMLDAVIKLEGDKAPHVCISSLFIIEGEFSKDGELDAKLLGVYPGEETICEYQEE